MADPCPTNPCPADPCDALRRRTARFVLLNNFSLEQRNTTGKKMDVPEEIERFMEHVPGRWGLEIKTRRKVRRASNNREYAFTCLVCKPGNQGSRGLRSRLEAVRHYLKYHTHDRIKNSDEHSDQFNQFARLRWWASRRWDLFSSLPAKKQRWFAAPPPAE